MSVPLSPVTLLPLHSTGRDGCEFEFVGFAGWRRGAAAAKEAAGEGVYLNAVPNSVFQQLCRRS
jgi:hypothetical protein